MKDGILIINKPKGITSHDVVVQVRRKLGIRRIGHSGTLDPLATGVLVILVGRCTKLFNQFLKLDKEYMGWITLGIKTSTGDIDGEIIERKDFINIREEVVKNVFSSYVGEIKQVPPMFSALKHKGKRLYSLARKGITVDRLPRRIVIKELRLLGFNPPNIQFYLKCSSGTYIRQLAEDIAKDLGCVGCILELKRQAIGPYSIAQAAELSGIEEGHVISPTGFNLCNPHF